jgi:hypothetical protein
MRPHMKNLINKMKSIRLNSLMVVALIILAIIPIIYFFTHRGETAFLDSTMGNWFATMAGAFVGVISALELYKWQEKREDIVRERETKIKEREEYEHSLKIMTLISDELDHNKNQIIDSNTLAKHENTERLVFSDGLKVELWDALSDGGELQWIKDPELIDIISRAYHYIRREIELESIFLEILYSPQHHDVDAKSGSQGKLIHLLRQLDNNTLKYIQRALAQIEDEKDRLLKILKG